MVWEIVSSRVVRFVQEVWNQVARRWIDGWLPNPESKFSKDVEPELRARWRCSG
jgi:hypothetical protein